MKTKLLEKKKKLRKFLFTKRRKLYSSTPKIFDEMLFENYFKKLILILLILYQVLSQ